MVSRFHLSTVILIAAGVWALLLVLQGTSVTAAFFRPWSNVLGAIFVLLTIFDKWGWRLRVLRPWFVFVPDLNGLWNGRLISNWINPQTGEGIPPIDATINIKQTFSAIQLRLKTNESESELLLGGLVRKNDGTYQIAGVYRNTPQVLLRERSPIHHGGLILDVIGSPPSALRGEYWTDRGTQGELQFEERKRK